MRDGLVHRRSWADWAAASECRAWVESLEVEPALRPSLVEPIAAVEEALAALEREARATG